MQGHTRVYPCPSLEGDHVLRMLVPRTHGPRVGTFLCVNFTGYCCCGGNALRKSFFLTNGPGLTCKRVHIRRAGINLSNFSPPIHTSQMKSTHRRQRAFSYRGRRCSFSYLSEDGSPHVDAATY